MEMQMVVTATVALGGREEEQRGINRSITFKKWVILETFYFTRY